MVQEIFQAAHDAHQAGQLDRAESLYRQGLAQEPGHSEALHMLGVVMAQKGWYPQAADLMRRAIAINPRVSDYYFNLGLTLGYCGEWDAAMECYRQTLALEPRNAAASDQLAIILDRQGRLDEAIQAWSAAVESCGDVAAYHANLGTALSKKKQFDQAIARYHQAIRLAPRDPTIQGNLALVLAESGRIDEALAAYEKAMELDPRLVWVQCNLAELLTAKDRREEAKAIYRRVIEADPKSFAAQNNLGALLQDEGDLGSALLHYRTAVENAPDSIIAHWNYARILLQLGHFPKGWEEAEWRLKIPNLKLNRNFPQPQWDGSNPAGKTILLHAEGGHGDALHFVRFVPQVAALGAKLILECHPGLVPLFQGIPGLAAIIPRGANLPDFDFHIPLQGLPRIFKITLSNIPSQVPYLAAPDDRVEKWARRLAGETKMRVGLVWSGTRYAKLEARTRALDTFAPLAAIPGVKFFSLQKGEDSSQTRPPQMDFVDWTAELNDFADTAALVQNLDLVIGVDTAVIHLAGALGKPVWVLIPFRSDFRWLTDRADSPWYPTMRLFRQKQPDDWETPVRELTLALFNEVGAALFQKGKFDQSAEAFKKAVNLRPAEARSHRNLALALAAQGNIHEAIVSCRTALQLKSDYAECWNNLGGLLAQQDQNDEAIAAFQRAIELRPDYLDAHMNLSHLNRILGRLEEAISAGMRAVQIQPSLLEANLCVANALVESHRLEEALAVYQRMIQLYPDIPELHGDMGLLYLRHGDFARGLPEYEWRWKTAGRRSRVLPQPQWDGSDLRGKTILLHNEQGLGDAIQFIRYLPMIAARGGRIILACDPVLMRLFQQLPSIAQFIPLGGVLPHLDVHCAVTTLPLVFKTDLDSIPAVLPLRADPKLAEAWKQKMSSDRSIRKIGLVWSGSPRHPNDRQRSVQLSQLAPLTTVKGASFYSLQMGEAVKQISATGISLHDFTSEIKDFADTAALIENLDLVISVDTSVAHLAGTMQKKVWLLLPYTPDWRWLLERADSSWYPTMRLFRQTSLNDWQDPISRMTQALAEWVNT